MKRPIIIIGAGRSGTKLLRTVLNAAAETAAFPREINYIWRHGNIGYPTDELTVAHATRDVQEFVQKQFSGLSRRFRKERIIEKTCANSLRVAYVHTILPDAYIVHIVRDGRAVAESARRRWRAKPEIKYLLEKLRWVPLQDVPYYGWRYARYQFGRFRKQGSGVQSSWGPRFAGIDELVEEKSLLEVCGIQWRECVQSAKLALQELPQAQVYTLRYEDLIANPVRTAHELYAWSDLTLTKAAVEFIKGTVHAGNLEKWRAVLNEQEVADLLPHIEDAMDRFDYEL